MFRETWEKVVVCTEGAILAAVLIVFVIARIKAGHYGMIKIKFPLYPVRFALLMIFSGTLAALSIMSLVSYRKYSAHIDDMRERGMVAVAEYENTTVDALLNGGSGIGEETYEEIYIEIETARFQIHAEDSQRNAAIFGMNALAFALVTVMSSGAYITRKGVIFSTGFRTIKTSVRIDQGKIRVYINGDFDRAIAKYPVTSTNRKIFYRFMPEESED